MPQLFRSQSLTKDPLFPDDSIAALHAPIPQSLHLPSGLHPSARPSLPQPSRSSGDIFHPGLAQAPPPAPPASTPPQLPPTSLKLQELWSSALRPLPGSSPGAPLLRPSSRSHRRHARAPAGPRTLASPTPPLGDSPALLSKPPSRRAHLSTRTRGLPRARAPHTQACTLLPTRACPSPRARARTSPHRCTHFHTRAHHLPSPAAQHSPRGARSDGVQPLPRSLRSKNSAASSRRCTLIIRTRSMGSALPPPADRRRHRRLQSHDAPGHVRRAGGPARPRLGALSAAPAVPAAPAAQPAVRARFVYFSARARGRDQSSGEDRLRPPLPMPPGKCSPAPATARRESRDTGRFSAPAQEDSAMPSGRCSPSLAFVFSLKDEQTKLT